MQNIGSIIDSIALLIVGLGAVVVLIKVGGLIDTLSSKIKEWKS